MTRTTAFASGALALALVAAAPPPPPEGDVGLVVAPADLLVEGLRDRYAPGEPLRFRVRVPRANVVRASVDVVVLQGRGDGATPVYRDEIPYDRFTVGDTFPVEVRLPASHQREDMALLVRVAGLREDAGDRLESFEDHFTYNLAWDTFGGVRAGEGSRLPERLLFASDRYALTGDHEAVLAKVAEAVRRRPSLDHVLVEGHADRVGAEGYNLELSRKRALAAVEWLASHGVPRDRIRHLAFGFSHPYVRMADAQGPGGRDADRRVEFVVFETDPARKAR